jgi:hypothetical protein
MTVHAEIPIKVNAWVDEGVSPLVCALNDFPDLETLDSCEADDNGAYVLFRWRGKDPVRFAADLGRAIPDSTEWLLQAEWRTGSTEPLLALSCPPNSTSALADALSCARKRLFCDDSPGKGPRS